MLKILGYEIIKFYHLLFNILQNVEEQENSIFFKGYYIGAARGAVESRVQ